MAAKEVNRDELEKVLSISRECLSAKKVFPALTHFCFKDGKLNAFNGIMGVEINFDLGMDCIVPGIEFFNLVKSYSCESLFFEKKDHTLLLSSKKSGGSKAKLKVLPMEESEIFLKPNLDNLENGTSFPVSPKLIEGIGKCLPSVNQNPLLRNQFGLNFYYEGDNLVLYSTTGKSASSYLVSDFKPFGEVNLDKMILPESFCKLVISIDQMFSEVGTIFLSNDFVIVDFHKVMIFTKVDEDAGHLNFKDIFDSAEVDKSLMKDIPEELVESAKRNSGFLSSETDKIIHLKLNEKNMVVSGVKSRGSVEDFIQFDSDIGEGELKLDASLFSQSLYKAGKISFKETDKGWVFISKSENFIHLLSAF